MVPRDFTVTAGRRGSNVKSMNTTLAKPITKAWQAVGIVGGAWLCPASAALEGARLLSNEAPHLPLSDCSSPWRCKCTYEHRADRRSATRRITDLESRHNPPRSGKDQRQRTRALGGRLTGLVRKGDSPNSQTHVRGSFENAIIGKALS